MRMCAQRRIWWKFCRRPTHQPPPPEFACFKANKLSHFEAAKKLWNLLPIGCAQPLPTPAPRLAPSPWPIPRRGPKDGHQIRPPGTGAPSPRHGRQPPQSPQAPRPPLADQLAPAPTPPRRLTMPRFTDLPDDFRCPYQAGCPYLEGGPPTGSSSAIKPWLAPNASTNINWRNCTRSCWRSTSGANSWKTQQLQA